MNHRLQLLTQFLEDWASADSGSNTCTASESEPNKEAGTFSRFCTLASWLASLKSTASELQIGLNRYSSTSVQRSRRSASRDCRPCPAHNRLDAAAQQRPQVLEVSQALNLFCLDAFSFLASHCNILRPNPHWRGRISCRTGLGAPMHTSRRRRRRARDQKTQPPCTKLVSHTMRTR